VMGKGNGHYGKLKTRASSKSVPHAHFHAQLYMNIESVHEDTNTHSRRDLKPLACSIIMKNNTPFFFFLVMNKITQTYYSCIFYIFIFLVRGPPGGGGKRLLPLPVTADPSITF
jgi:hypothetical protein